MSTSTTQVDERHAEADRIIRKNTYWSMGMGSVPIPLVDLLGVGGFQVKMIAELSDLYGVKFSEHSAKNLISALVGTLGSRVLTMGVVGSMIKTLPFAGALIGGVLAMPVIAGAITYGVGKVFEHHFESGGTLLDFEAEKMKGLFARFFKDGKKLATEAKPVNA